MIKVFTPTLSIKLASKPKRSSKFSGNVISRKCLAVVTKIENEYKAIVNYDKQAIRVHENDELSNEQLILPFTEKSLELRDKEYVFLKEKDKYGHNVCVIREYMDAHLNPGTPTQYDVVKENILIAGHIVRKNGKMYFEYEDLVAYYYLSESRIRNINVDNTKPLFTK